MLVITWTFPSAMRSPLLGSRMVFGRGDDCDVVLPGRETSRHHAEAKHDGPIWVLRDLGSTNGISVNGSARLESPLAPDDLVRIGEWLGVVESVPSGEPFVPPSELALGLIAGARLAACLAPLRSAARIDLPVVLEGDTGTGKECVARALHEWSGRSGEFVAVNCAALPESLAEAELFGYRRGAFTGASRDSNGYFRAAHRGTLLLDEIVELPLGLQAKLLRVVERHEVIPLGEAKPIPIDVRLVAAAQRPLRSAVEAGRFRADLHARLEGLSIELLPLRERRADIPALLIHVLTRAAGGQPPRLDPTLIERLSLYDWPYNVRELVQTAKRMLALHANEPILSIAHLPPQIRDAKSAAGASANPSQKRGEALLERLVLALRGSRGNVAQACVELGISRQRAYRLLERGRVDLDELRFPDGSELDGSDR